VGGVVGPGVVDFEPMVADTGLPPRPDPALWPYLDAAARCIERFGFQRTGVRDVAREAGVDRTTVYRHVGSMDHILRLLIARDLHIVMERVPQRIVPGRSGPDQVVEILAGTIEHALRHPALVKILQDEPEVAGRLLPTGVSALVRRVATTLAPLLAAAMDTGLVARRDPMIVTEWIARIGLSLLVAPPPGDIRPFLHEVLDPVLTPIPPRRSK
jgi:AcrR family transcriptional regulator